LGGHFGDINLEKKKFVPLKNSKNKGGAICQKKTPKPNFYFSHIGPHFKQIWGAFYYFGLVL